MTNSNGKDNTKDDTGSASTDRRNFLKAAGAAGAGAVAVAGATHGKFALAPITAAQADTTSMPKLSDQKWWPSKWGADDQAGASNHITPAKVLDTAKWIKDGKIYKLGHNYESTMPLFGKRVFTLRIPGSPTGGPFGDNRLVYHDEFVATEIGFEAPILASPALAPDGDYPALQQLIAEHSSREGVLFVGHNPNLHQFIARLIAGNGNGNGHNHLPGGGSIRLRKGSIARVDLATMLTSGPRAPRSTSSVRAERASSGSRKSVSILLITRATATGWSPGRSRRASRR